MELEPRVERRLTYSYGVNKDHNVTGFYPSFEVMKEIAVERSWGPVNVDKREERFVLVLTTEWEEVNG